MNKQRLSLVAIALILGLVGLVVYAAGDNSNTVINTEPTQQIEQTKIDITIGDEESSVRYDGVEGETALATLKELTNVETESSDFGEFVTSISGKTADSSREFWSFYVNGSQAEVGAGTYEAVAGDKIEWRLEEFSL